MSSWDPIATEAPDVMITGIDVMRSSCQPQYASDGEDDTENWLRWSIFGRPSTLDDDDEAETDGPGLVLYGDLTVVENSWSIAVTSIVRVRFRNVSVAEMRRWDRDQTDDAVAIYGAWANHALYDVAAARARALGVQSYVTDVTIPVVTPEPTFIRLSEAQAD